MRYHLTRAIMIYGTLISASHGQWAWTTVDHPSATKGTTAYGIDGNIIVGWYRSSVGRGFVRDGSTWEEHVEGTYDTYFYGVSGNTIVGDYYVNGSPKGFTYERCCWYARHKLFNRRAYGISNGMSVGDFETDNTGRLAGWFQTTPTYYTVFEKPGADWTSVRNVSGSTLVGRYADSTGQHGFRYNITNAIWTTLDYPGATATSPNDVDGDLIVGDYVDGAGRRRGFLFDGTHWITLDFPGAQNTAAFGISGNKIVGGYAYGDGHIGAYNCHGFVLEGAVVCTSP